MNRMHIGIVIVSWNVSELLDQCLNSLQKAFDDKSIQLATQTTPLVFVVDNASADDSVEMIRAKYPWVMLHASPENLGYVSANNYAIKTLLTDHNPRPDAIWLLNPDTIVHKTTIAKLIDFLMSRPKAGLIGPRLVNPDGTLQESAFRFPGLLQPLFDFGVLPQRFYYTVLNGRYSDKSYTSNKPFEVDHPLGASMMARTECIDDIGLLDEMFFMYCEEIDWAWRMKNSGWECWIVPSAIVTHYGGASTSQDKPASTAHLWESRARLYQKHRSTFLYRIVARIIQNYFSNQKSGSPEWKLAYQKIINAWRLYPKVEHSDNSL